MEDKIDVHSPKAGMFTDNVPVEQKDGTYRFALNVVNENDTTRNEGGNAPCGEFPTSFYPVGKVYTNDERTIVTLVSEDEKLNEIGIIDKNCKYTTIVHGALGFKLNKQIQLTYRLRRGCEDVIYFTDGNQNVMYFNFSKPEEFYTEAYKSYLESGSTTPFLGTIWDTAKFNLFPAYKVPCFTSMNVLVGGSTPSGTYNFALQYLDDNLNPTNFMYSSQLVAIYDSNLETSFGDINGSSNILVDALAGTANTNKSIRLGLSGLDQHYKFYKIAVIIAASKTGEVTEVLLSPAIPISRDLYTYDGNIQGYTKISVEDIKVSKPDIASAEHIEQIEDKLILSNVKGKQVQYCNFQRFASKIASHYIIRESSGTDVKVAGSSKSPNTYWEETSYMGGDVYALAIVYVDTDGLESPAYPIPGRPPSYYRHLDGTIISADDQLVIQDWNKDVAFINPNEAVYNALPINRKAKKWQVYDSSVKFGALIGAMGYHENNGVFYESKKDCSDSDYWGVDCCGFPLTGKPVRHHKFPSRFKENHVRNGTIFSGMTGIYMDVSLLPDKTFPEVPPTLIVEYEVNGVPGTKTTTFVATDLPAEKILVIEAETDFEGINIIAVTGTIVDSPEIFAYNVYKQQGNSTFIDTTIVRNLGIQFSNIEYPHSDIVGHYFVRGKRDDQNRLVLDKGFTGRMRNKLIDGIYYRTFSYFKNYQNEPSWDNYLFMPKIQFSKESLNGEYLKYEGEFVSPNIYAASVEEDGAGSVLKEVNTVIEYRTKSYGGFASGRGNQNYVVNNKTTMDALAKDQKYKGLEGPMYNLSFTNRIGIATTTVIMPDVGDNMAYVSYNVNRNIHPVLDDITYHRIHNCMLTRANSNVVFGGDTYISRWDFANSMYRKRKGGILKGLLNVILIAGIAVAAVATAGAAGVALAPAISAIIAGASATGIAAAVAVTALVAGAIGVTAQAIQTIQAEIDDGVVDQLTHDSQFDDLTGRGIRLSSYIAYANEALLGLYVESEINVSLAQDEKHICGNMFKASQNMYDYFRAKWMYFDTDTEKWTTKGFACPEVYNYNKDYSRQNEQSVYFALPSTYDCCSDCKESHPNRTHWSEESFQEELTDNYRIFKPNNYRDIEGERGDITNVIKRNNNLFIQTSEALWRLPQSNQERVTNEIVSFLGTGDFFSLRPQKLIDNEIGTAGTQHKWATLNTTEGLLIVNEIEGKIYLYDQSFNEISKIGRRDFFRDNLKDSLAKQFKLLTNKDFPNQNNPANPYGVGIHSTWDSYHNRIIITKRDYLINPSHINNFVLVHSDEIGNLPTGLLSGQLVFDINTNKFLVSGGQPDLYEKVMLNNRDYFENKSFTTSFDLKSQYKSWTSTHSYIPNFYIYTHKNLYSTIAGSNQIWKHNIKGLYQSFYGNSYPHIVEMVFVKDRLTTEIWNDITLQTTALRYVPEDGDFVEERFITFNKFVAYNRRQSTGELTIKPKDQDESENYMLMNITDQPGIVLADRSEKDWSINDLRDNVIDPTKSLFLKNWAATKDQYYIDKVVNQANINYLKDWIELESLRDKYLIVILKFDNFTNVQLSTNYLLDSKAPSFR